MASHRIQVTTNNSRLKSFLKSQAVNNYTTESKYILNLLERDYYRTTNTIETTPNTKLSVLSVVDRTITVQIPSELVSLLNLPTDRYTINL